MNWYLDGSNPDSLTELRHEFADYLSRHAAPGSDVDGAVLTFSELVGNAMLHAGGDIWVAVDWATHHPLLTVWDMGPQFQLASVDMPSPKAPQGRGLAIATVLTERLAIAAREGGGAKVEAELPIERKEEAHIEPPRTLVDVLPSHDEAGPDGFSKEPFLRALVVQLSQELEWRHGPEAAEHVVAQVGTSVGGQMEDEYREAKSIVGRMTPNQMADCYVRLKHAIDGGFFVIEATDERIILGNTACPFGPAVRKSPALCRMTSSVFGGIAARNAGDSTVVLEERIAVGDPGCKVVVNLGTLDMPAHGHRYPAAHEDNT
ncbi:MAG: ATP-binding protein [Acidimicrobiia bacterium]|nr:ATP-binding protein [Acidimicrobiia bacterium]